ncbi:hypothetical protein DEO72_LG2g3996 [Vigna unguiculata]|uniref:Uncharacterized protein n=1 Tax=Vigna unguiculata TaxID=3917 RepID=A0A4D6L596_VIGUN|nr:hypothetical protein DEO72_LG2g3996 [Vigna unguiculata]
MNWLSGLALVCFWIFPETTWRFIPYRQAAHQTGVLFLFWHEPPGGDEFMPGGATLLRSILDNVVLEFGLNRLARLNIRQAGSHKKGSRTGIGKSVAPGTNRVPPGGGDCSGSWGVVKGEKSYALWCGTVIEPFEYDREFGMRDDRRSKTQKGSLQRLAPGGETRSARRTRDSELLYENIAPGGGTKIARRPEPVSPSGTGGCARRLHGSSPFLICVFVYGDDRVIRYTGADVGTGKSVAPGTNRVPPGGGDCSGSWGVVKGEKSYALWCGTVIEPFEYDREFGMRDDRRSKTQKGSLQRLAPGGETRSARRTRDSELLYENIAPGGGTKIARRPEPVSPSGTGGCARRLHGSSPFLICVFVYGDDRVIRYTGADVGTGDAEDD